MKSLYQVHTKQTISELSEVFLYFQTGKLKQWNASKLKVTAFWLDQLRTLKVI